MVTEAAVEEIKRRAERAKEAASKAVNRSDYGFATEADAAYAEGIRDGLMDALITLENMAREE